MLRQDNNLRFSGGALGAMLLMLLPAGASGQGEDRILFDFSGGDAVKDWRAVNDGVMGGLSQGGATVNGEAGALEFSGTLSLQNNGGFSSIRTRGPAMDLSEFEGLAVRFRGDGRTYSLTAHTDYPLMAGSYRADLPPAEKDWKVIHLPFEGFVATSFGRRLPDAPALNREVVRSLGFILADKKAGPFKLEVDWIKAYRHAGTARGTGDLIDVAVGNGNFTTLATLLEAANLVDPLRGEGPFTVFAPSDDAFARLPAGTVARLLEPENKESLAAILTYHVIPGRLTSERVVALPAARTLNGQRVEFRVEGGTVRVGSASVQQPDVAASNGVIHVIDSVLIPAETAAMKARSPAAQARRLIELAIRRGVPMYNAGNEAACAAIYEVAAHGLMAMSPGLFEESHRRRMQATLEGLEDEDSMDRRAWTLRHLLDAAYHSLD